MFFCSQEDAFSYGAMQMYLFAARTCLLPPLFMCLAPGLFSSNPFLTSLRLKINSAANQKSELPHNTHTHILRHNTPMSSQTKESLCNSVDGPLISNLLQSETLNLLLSMSHILEIDPFVRGYTILLSVSELLALPCW